MAAQGYVGRAIFRIGRRTPREEQVSESCLVKLPEGFVIGLDLRTVPRKVGVAGRESGLQQAIEVSLIVAIDLCKVGLESVIARQRSLGASLHRVDVVELLSFAGPKRKFEHQHPAALNPNRFGRDPLHRNGRAMLRFENERAPGFVPVNLVVGFSGRIHKPRGGFFGYRGADIETESDFSRAAAQVLYADRLCGCPAVGRHECFRRELQPVGFRLADEAVWIPAVGKRIPTRRIRDQNPAVQEYFARQQKTRTPRHLGNTATSERRHGQGSNTGNRLRSLHIPKFILRSWKIVEIPPHVDEAIAGQIVDSRDRRQAFAGRGC